MKFPKELKYTNDHEWVKISDNIATVGITDFAQKELGEIVFVELELINVSIDIDDVFGSVEAVKTVSELFMPISGKIIAINEKLQDAPELVNEDPYEEGWMVKIEVSDSEELISLMDAAAYKKLVN